MAKVAFANLGGLRHAVGSLRRTEGGGGEIRTLGGLPHTDFPGLRTRPLCDASKGQPPNSDMVRRPVIARLKAFFNTQQVRL